MLPIMLELNKIHLIDCMEAMRGMPDNYFDLAIVDPEYGIGASGKKFHSGVNGKPDKRWKSRSWKPFAVKDWDTTPATSDYFKELFRVSKNQIIWGGNYFSPNLPPSMGWIFWDKDNGNASFSDGELAFSSFDKGLRKFKYLWSGFQKQKPETRVHPTQKPEALMLWLLDNYAQPGDKILDTHSGSGSVARACVKRGFDFLACEIDPDYHKDSLRLLAQAKAGLIARTDEEIRQAGGQLSILEQCP